MMAEQLIWSCENEPYYNLALEEELLHRADAPTLFLWQNRPTVVVGQSQNVYAECDPYRLADHDIRLARRLSGGGAVYQDLGNLNFTLLCPEEQDDPELAAQLLADALAALGVSYESSGRNDLCHKGLKFSGMAWYGEGGACYRHGTLMVNVDLEAMDLALTPSALKLERHGLRSVRSRVMNLCQLDPDLTVKRVAQAVANAFRSRFPGCGETVRYELSSHIPPRLDHYMSPDWNFGRRPVYAARMELSLPQGQFQLYALVEDGIIREAQLYTDSLELPDLTALAAGLTGCLFEETAVLLRLQNLGLCA